MWLAVSVSPGERTWGSIVRVLEELSGPCTQAFPACKWPGNAYPLWRLRPASALARMRTSLHFRTAVFRLSVAENGLRERKNQFCLFCDYFRNLHFQIMIVSFLSISQDTDDTEPSQSVVCAPTSSSVRAINIKIEKTPPFPFTFSLPHPSLSSPKSERLQKAVSEFIAIVSPPMPSSLSSSRSRKRDSLSFRK